MFVHEYNLTCFYTLLLTSLLSQCQVMYCFTELLRNFANVELARQQDLQQPSEKHTEHEMNRWGMFSRGQGALSGLKCGCHMIKIIVFWSQHPLLLLFQTHYPCIDRHPLLLLLQTHYPCTVYRALYIDTPTHAQSTVYRHPLFLLLQTHYPCIECCVFQFSNFQLFPITSWTHQRLLTAH